MTPRARLPIAMALVLLVALVPAGPASACSCAGGNPRDRLQEAGAAFIGRLLDVDGDVQTARYTFAVDEAIKGSFAETLTIEASGNGASCGFEVETDRPVGILLHRWRHGWSSGLCSQIGPDELRSAVAPLTVSADAGLAVALAGGSFGEAQVAALDAEGRMVAWGWGRAVTTSLSVCPGGRVALEQVTAAPSAGLKGARYLSVRNVADLESRRLASFPEREMGNVYRVVCAAPDGSAALVASTRNLSLYRDGAFRRLAEGVVYDAVLIEPNIAYAIRKRSIVRVDLGGGEVRLVGTLDDRRLSLELSQDGQFLAVARDWVAAEGSPYVLVARLDEEPLRFRPAARHTLTGFPAVSLPDDALPPDTFDVSALEQPVPVEAAPRPAHPSRANPSFGPVAAVPRSGRGPGGEDATTPAWPWIAGVFLVGVAGGAVVLRRRSR
ncbi:MAG: hypothetical protein ACRDHI_03100 [Actinomycetota bacterium]